LTARGYVVGLVLCVALIYLIRFIARHIPPPYRRHGPGQDAQAIDHRAGHFGKSYPEELIIPERMPKIGRNVACSCGSGKKYKRCCGR
jgi:hypothetical protein